jgi:hypothetical protein
MYRRVTKDHTWNSICAWMISHDFAPMANVTSRTFSASACNEMASLTSTPVPSVSQASAVEPIARITVKRKAELSRTKRTVWSSGSRMDHCGCINRQYLALIGERHDRYSRIKQQSYPILFHDSCLHRIQAWPDIPLAVVYAAT